MTEADAFKYVDWNVMAILVGIWIIAGYFGKTGVPSWLSVQALRLSGGRPGLLVIILSLLAGVISMFVDNVVTILMMAPVALPLARALSMPATPVILMIGFGANFMGTALIIGDLPPQMLHSVAGAEFFDFIWQFGRPSSFPILMVTFMITLAVDVFLRFPRHPSACRHRRARRRGEIPDPPVRHDRGRLVPRTVFAMSHARVHRRQARLYRDDRRDLLVLVLELLGERVKAASFEEIMQELDWRAIFFYIALFALVGGLEKTHILDKLAHAMKPLFIENYALGATLLYWVTIPIVGLVEHDAYILTFLLHDPRPGQAAGVDALAAVVDAAVVGNARQQPDCRRRAGALCRTDARGEGGRAEGLAARVPRRGAFRSPWSRPSSATCWHADLGPALREMRRSKRCSRTF